MVRAWSVSRLASSRWSLALLVPALIAAACSGPDDTRAPATTTNTVPAIVTSTLPLDAAPTATTAAATTPAPGLPTATPAIATASPASTVALDEAFCDSGVELLAATDVLDKTTYDGDEVGGLSALAWDGESATYYALSDRGGRLYRLDFSSPDVPTISSAFRLRDASGEPDDSIDGEGLAIMANGDLVVSSEVEPSIRRYMSDGEFIADLSVPDHFLVEPAGRGVGNRTFESLALSPSGAHLFTAVEEPLAGDGATDEGRGRIRILRYDETGDTFEPGSEYLYLTEPNQSVSEIVAISDTELLVLERGLSLIEGFSARIYRVSLESAEDVSDIERLEEVEATPIEKSLLVDVADCPSGDLGSFGGINALLDNFESMALGPPQPDGRQTLIIGSDDNHQSFQVTRFLVFAINPDRF